MTLRGTLYRCHFFTFGGPQTEGALSRWTRDFQPVTDLTMARPGQLVELYSQVERHLLPDPLAAIYRFDVLEEDVFLAGSDDVVVTITGPGAHAIDADWPQSARVLTKLTPNEGRSPVDAARAFRREHDTDFFDYIVVIEPEPATEPYHVVTWWTAEGPDDPGSECELYYILNVKTADSEFDDQTEETLDLPIVEPVGPEVGALHMRIASPDEEDDQVQASLAFSLSDAVVPGPPEAVSWALSNDEPEPESVAVHDEPLPTKVRPTPPAPAPAPPPQEAIATTNVDIVAGEDDTADKGCMPDDVMARFLRRPPSADRSDDTTVFGDAASHGEVTVAIVNNFTPLKFRSQPHPVVYNLRRAIREGNALYRTVGYVVVEGPITVDDASRGYHVLPLEEPLTRDELAIHRGYLDKQVFPVKGYYYALEIKSRDHGFYLLRTIATADDILLFASTRHRDVYFCEHRQTDENSEEAALSPAAKAHIAGLLSNADQKLQSDRDAALEEISRLGGDAFALATSTQRGNYLKAYFGDWWLSERDQRSLRQIVLASASPEEVRDHIDAMKAEGGLDRMIGNLNGGVFGFLGDVGGRFEKELAPRYPFTFDEVASWIVDQSSRKISIPIVPPGVPGGISINRQTGEVSFDVHALEQLQTALTSFLQFVVGTVADLYHLVSDPGKLFDAIGQLMDLIIAAELARWGHEPSRAKLKRLGDQLGKHVKHLYYALRLLNLEERLVQQLRWRIMWEVASMFVGIGEIKAAVSATRGAIASTRITERAASIGRLAKALLADERGILELENVARAFSRTTKAESELALRALADLPEGQLGRLSAAVSEANPAAARTLTQLAEAAPTVAARQVIQESADMVKTALQTEKRVGRRLHDEAREGLRRLFEVPGLPASDVRRVLSKLRPDDTELFLRAAGRLLEPPATGAATAARLTPELIGQLAQHPRAIQLVMLRHEQSPAVLLRLVEDAGGNMYTAERAADAVQSVLWSRADRSRREAQSLIDRVVANEPGALQDAVGAVDGYLRATGRAADADRLAAAAAKGTSRDLRGKLGQALRERARQQARAGVDDFMERLARGEAAAVEETRTARLASSVLNGDARVGGVVDPRYRSLVENALNATSQADVDRALAELRQLADQELAAKVRAAVSTPPNEMTPELARLRRQLQEGHPGVFPSQGPTDFPPLHQALSDIAVDNAASALANRFAERTAKRVEATRIGRSLDPAVLLPNNPEGQRLLRAIDAEGWESVISKGDGFLSFYRSNPGAATPIVAGQLREELMYVAPSFGEVMNRARQRASRLAQEEGIILNDVRLMRSQGGQNFGKMVGDTAPSIAGESALTDNFIGAFDQNGNLHVLSVYESKSMTNVDALFPSSDLLTPGQVLRDIERLDATALKVEDLWLDAEKIVVGRSRTEWVLAIPPDVPFPEAGLRRLLGESGTLNLNGRVLRSSQLPPRLPLGAVARHPLNNGEVQGTMRRIMQALDGARP